MPTYNPNRLRLETVRVNIDAECFQRSVPPEPGLLDARRPHCRARCSHETPTPSRRPYQKSQVMISLTTLLASATVAAAAKKVEEAPAPGIVDTVLGFVPSWLGGPVAQVFDKGVETLGCVFGWITAGTQVPPACNSPRAGARFFHFHLSPPDDVTRKDTRCVAFSRLGPPKTTSRFSRKNKCGKIGCIAVEPD